MVVFVKIYIYQDSDFWEEECETDCRGNGKCIKQQCVCFDEYFGVDCSLVECPNNCSLRGSSDHSSGKRQCKEG
jgi:syndecan 4